MFHVPNQYRIVDGFGAMNSNPSFGNNGAFLIDKDGIELFIVASDGLGWDHVSVHTAERCPTWEEMCFLKDLFWDDTDCVVQYHPIKDQYVNNHPNCLHMWKCQGSMFPSPPKELV
jgi:hypothetical protein